MVGTKLLDEPVIEEIVFGKYGRVRDLTDTYTNSIVLVERGSDVKDEIVYFSDKENNVANVGAKAILVYNNKPGIFFGELMHESTAPNYEPRIPALSMSYEDGTFLKKLLQNKTYGSIDIFYNPDFVAHFSSRGPVSPFYIKPDIVAPGAFVNTTLTNGEYNFTSGTSFAAPHVTGAAALLLQKNPELRPDEIKSILTTTTDIVSDAYGNKFPFEAAGSGRINITKAISANLIILPHFLTFHPSSEDQTQTKNLELFPIDGNLNDVKLRFVGPEVVDFEYQQKEKLLEITVSVSEAVFGEYQGMIIVDDGVLEYHVPILIQKTQGVVNVFEKNGRMDFTISHPDDWTYAKISIINKDSGKTDTTSTTPEKDASISVIENGEYWIIAQIKVDGNTFDAYDVVNVKTASINNFDLINFLNIPERPIAIILVVAIIISLVGLKLRN